MFRSLYSRLLALFLAILLIAMGTLTFFLYGRIREDKVNERLAELTNQARDVAQLAAQRSLYDTRSADQYMIWKSQEITKEYDAYLIIVDRYRNVIPIGDETVVDGGDMTLEETFTYLGRVLAGETIHDRALTSAGKVVFTVGAPYIEKGRVLGAVFIHASSQIIEAAYQRTERRGELSRDPAGGAARADVCRERRRDSDSDRFAIFYGTDASDGRRGRKILSRRFFAARRGAQPR